jgi:gluconate 2-dehydrogenase gamma chain
MHQLFDQGTSRRGFIASALLAIGVAGVPLSACNAKKTSGLGRFFKPAHFAILDAVTETIMPRTDTPGARDVLVAKRIDTLMNSWASAQTQTDFTRILDEIDAAAKGIAALPPAKQLEVVAAYDKAKMRDPAYGKFKNLVFALYYLSEPGATQELRYEHVPGAWEPSIPVTADTRGYAFDLSI